MYFCQGGRKKNFQGISLENDLRSNLKGIPWYFFQGGREKKIVGILCEMNPDQISSKFFVFFSWRTYQFIWKFLYEIYEGFVFKSAKLDPHSSLARAVL